VLLAVIVALLLTDVVVDGETDSVGVKDAVIEPLTEALVVREFVAESDIDVVKEAVTLCEPELVPVIDTELEAEPLALTDKDAVIEDVSVPDGLQLKVGLVVVEGLPLTENDFVTLPLKEVVSEGDAVEVSVPVEVDDRLVDVLPLRDTLADADEERVDDALALSEADVLIESVAVREKEPLVLPDSVAVLDEVPVLDGLSVSDGDTEAEWLLLSEDEKVALPLTEALSEGEADSVEVPDSVRDTVVEELSVRDPLIDVDQVRLVEELALLVVEVLGVMESLGLLDTEGDVLSDTDGLADRLPDGVVEVLVEALRDEEAVPLALPDVVPEGDVEMLGDSVTDPVLDADTDMVLEVDTEVDEVRLIEVLLLCEAVMELLSVLLAVDESDIVKESDALELALCVPVLLSEKLTLLVVLTDDVIVTE
jgi:hypothetical protein